jgi:hypothetical protein
MACNEDFVPSLRRFLRDGLIRSVERRSRSWKRREQISCTGSASKDSRVTSMVKWSLRRESGRGQERDAERDAELDYAQAEGRQARGLISGLVTESPRAKDGSM